MKTGRIWLIAALAAVLVSCSSSEFADEAPAMVNEPQARSMIRDLAMGEVAASQEQAAGGVGFAVLASNQPDRYLIKNATVTIETDDARVATDQLTNALAPLNGYVSNLHETMNSLGKRTVTLQVRIPSNAFEEGMNTVESLGKVISKNVTTNDVTEEFVDTESRTRNLKQTEERILEHLSRTGSLDEILKIENELTRVRSEIERLEGRLRFLNDRVSYSTIAITFQERAKAEPVVPTDSFSTAQVASQAVRSLVGLLQVVWVMVIWIAIWSPVWAIVALVAYLAWRRNRRQVTFEKG